jgi:hypothetical protein
MLNSKVYPNGPSTLKKPLPWSNSTSAHYVTLQIENWMKQSQKHVGLAQHNGFGPAILPCLLLLVKGTAKPNTRHRRLINMI